VVDAAALYRAKVVLEPTENVRPQFQTAPWTCRGAGSFLSRDPGDQNSADNFSWITARIAIGRAPTTVKRTTPPVTARTLMFQPAGEPLTERTVNGNPSWRMTPRTSSSTSVAFIDR
jgi:hypothetical protein